MYVKNVLLDVLTKKWSLILVLFLSSFLQTFMLDVPCFAGNANNLSVFQPILKVSNTKGKPGEQVTVTVDAISNPGMAIGTMSIEYDPSVLTVVDAELGSLIYNVGDIHISYKPNQIRLGWLSFSNIINDGEVCNITFSVNPNTSDCYTNVKLKDVTIYDSSDNYIPFDLQDGIVDINIFSVVSHTYTNLSGNPVTVLTGGGSIKSLLVVKNNLNNSKEVVCAVVLYDADHKLKKILTQSKNVAAFGEEIFEGGFTLPPDIDGYYLKVLLWDGFSTMKPVLKPEIF